MSPATTTTTTTTTNASVVSVATSSVRVGELYWKQEGDYGWELGQVVAFQAQENTATWIRIDETSGEARDSSAFPPQMLNVDECPLYPANPLFTCVALWSVFFVFVKVFSVAC